MNATASSQTGCSDLASAPELCPYGAPAAATSPPAFVNKPYPFSNSYQISLLLNLTNTTKGYGTPFGGEERVPPLWWEERVPPLWWEERVPTPF